jgi:hypothetical protein
MFSLTSSKRIVMTPFKKGIIGWLIISPVIFGFIATIAGYGGWSGAIFGVIIGSGYYAAMMTETEKVIKK